MPNPAYHWLTRPEADSALFATMLAVNNIETLISSVMTIQPLEVKMPDALPDAILLTSRHAIHVLEQLPATAHTLPVFCVGEATAKLAQTLGYASTPTGDGNVLSLFPQILEAISAGARILYPSGEEIRVDMQTMLIAQKREVHRVIAYTADAALHLIPQLVTALKKGHVSDASFFSPRSAELAIRLLKYHHLETATKQIDAYCLSLPVAQAAATLPWKSVQVCATPTTNAMRDLIVSRRARSML